VSIFKSLGYALGRISGKKGTAVGNNQSKRIASAVVDFVGSHLDREFTASDLRRFVMSRVDGTAPGSADRIMRMLRKDGVINYALVSRPKSLYRGLAVAVTPAEVPQYGVALPEGVNASTGDNA